VGEEYPMVMQHRQGIVLHRKPEAHGTVGYMMVVVEEVL